MSYEINENTLAILTTDDNKTKIIENEKEYIIDSEAYKVMDYSCKYFGSSYEGRVLGTKAMINADYKLPVIIEESKNIIFFPTTSPRLKECSWISHNHIDKIEAEDYQTKVKFKNGKEIILDISHNTLNNQLLRASRLESVFLSRKNRQ